MSKPQSAATQVLAFLPPQALDLPTCTTEAPTFIPPCEIVWIPVGATVISAGGGVDGEGFNGEVICDEAAFNNIAASFAEMTSAGRRVWIDFDHEDGEAAAWVIAFRWDATRGIIAAVDWTDAGSDSLEGKSFYSFSPAFLIDPETSRPLSLIPGHAAGGLVNAPAFGARMPALIAARLGGLPLSPSTGKTASGGSPDSKNTAPTMSTPATPPAAAAVKAAEEPTLKDVMAAIDGVATRVKALEGDGDDEEKKKKKDAEEVAARERAAASAPAGSPLPAVVQAKENQKVVVVTAAL
ncbi:MAG TPA: phage protease, partial [Rariglobus sp.]|nr:phage protease [Rariglobus sp.]